MQELGERPVERVPYSGGLSTVMPAGKKNTQQNQQPVYRMPSGAPIVRVNLSGQPSKSGPCWPPGPDGVGQPAFLPPPPHGFPPMPEGWMPPPGMMPPGWPHGFPMPVPPPPPPPSGGLFPPPPPPPPPGSKNEGGSSEHYNQMDFSSFLAPPAPPPPPS